MEGLGWFTPSDGQIRTDQVKPGMVIAHPHGCSDKDLSATGGQMLVTGRSEPDGDGLVVLTGEHETIRQASDWPVRVVSDGG
jgi:hypothetical protein